MTGFDGSQTHMGNTVLGKGMPPERLERNAGANLPDLTGRLDTAPYLTPYSDIVAQLVLAHQTQMHNLITLTNYQTRLALYKPPGQAPETLSETARRQFERPAELLVRYLLFTNEARLEEPIRGTSGFTEEFQARGPRDG